MVLALLVLVAAVAAFSTRHRRLGVARALRLAALAASVVVSLLVLPDAWRDSPQFALVLVGIPLASCLAALAADVGERAIRATTWACAIVMLLWGLLTGLGEGFYFLGPALIMLAAAAASEGRKHALHGPHSPQQMS